MTETQAKSGAAGASTDAEDTSVETPTRDRPRCRDTPGSPTTGCGEHRSPTTGSEHLGPVIRR